MSATIPPSVFQSAIQAIDAGDVVALRLLLKTHPELANAYIRGCDPRANDRTLMLYAVDWPGGKPNSAAMLRALAENGADPNQTLNGGSEAALHWVASLDDHEHLIGVLLDAGADIDLPGSVVEGGTPLLNAAHFGKLGPLKTLIARGAAVCNLRVAAGAGRVDLIEAWYLGDGIFTEDAARMFPAASGGSGSLSQAESDELAHGAFAAAVFCGQYHVADWLLEEGLDINADVGQTRHLHQFAYRGSLSMCMYAVARGVDLDAHSREVPAPAHDVAMVHGNVEQMNYLIDQGADLSLELAAACGRLDRIIRGHNQHADPAALLAHTIGVRTVVGKPVASSLKTGRLAVARFLLQAYPGLEDRKVDEKTAFDRARELGDERMVALLMDERVRD